MKNKIFQVLLSIVFFSIAVYLLFKNTDIESIIVSFKFANFWLVLLALMFILSSTLIKVFRWKLMLCEGCTVKYRSVLSAYSIALFFSNILPFRLGDVFQVLYLNYKENISKSVILSSIVAYQLMDLIVILSVFLFSSFYFAISKNMIEMAFIVLSFLIFLILTYFIAHEKISSFLSKKKGKLFEKLHSFNETLKIFASPKMLIKIVILTLFLWITFFIQAVLILTAFGIKVSVTKGLLFIAVPILVSILPLTPGSFGLWELATVGTLMLFGVDKSLALAAAFATHFSGFIVGFIFGAYFIIKDKFTKFISTGIFTNKQF